MAGFLRGANRPPIRSGGNRERESFSESVAKGMTEKPAVGKPGMHEGSGKTEITHNPDGSHSVKHHDGEMSDHPNAGHMAAHLHAKHMSGEVGNIHSHDMGATTHHVGMDGEVSGPHEHGSVSEGTDHLSQMMSGDGPENQTSSVEPDGDETGSGAY